MIHKFRAWDKTNTCYVKHLFDIRLGGEGRIYRRIWGESGWETVNDIDIEFYTGLQDASGKEIYEGDILSCITEYPNSNVKPIKRIGTVMYKTDGSVGFIVRVEHEGNFTLNNLMWNMKVIGNIHENPELLERKDHEAKRD